MFTLVVLRSPLNPASREVRHLRETGKRLASFFSPTDAAELCVSLNGRVIPSGIAHIPRAGDFIAVCPVLRGGGGGGGKNPLQVVAALALTVVSFGLGGMAAAAWGSMAGYLTMGAAMYLGGSLLTAGQKAPKVDMPSFEGSAWENGYSWGAMKPLMQQGNAVPLTYGTVRIPGQLVGQHITTDGEHQYLNILLCGGEGPASSVSDIEINGNPVANFDTVSSGLEDLVLSDNIGEAFATESAPGTDTLGVDIEITFPSGIFNGSGVGSFLLTAEYQKSGGSWTPWLSETITAYRTDSHKITRRKDGLASGAYSVRIKATEKSGTFGITWTRLSSVGYTGSVAVETRLGENDQTPIPFFSDTYADQFFTLELTTTAWATYQTEGDGGAGLEIGLDFPQGLAYIGDDGSAVETWIKFSAQYRIVGAPAWTPWLTDQEIKATETQPIRRTFRVDNLAQGQYEVQCQITDRAGTSTRYVNKCVWSQLTHIVYDDFARPNKILVGMRALATDKLSGGMPSVSWLQTVSTVNVWDPGTSAYVEKSATNPAWIAYDLIHRCKKLWDINAEEDVYLGRGLPHTVIDYTAFSAWADYCDKLVAGEKRCLANIFLDASASLWDQLQKVAAIGRGIIILRGTQFSAVWDDESSPVQLFSVGNILRDSFQGQYLSTVDRADAIEVSFINEDKGYQRDTVMVYDDGFDTSTVTNSPTQIFLPGITKYTRAYREGLYRLRLNKYLKRSISFEADIDAVGCQIGDVISIQHDIPRWGYGGRLAAVESSSGEPSYEQEIIPADVAIDDWYGQCVAISANGLVAAVTNPNHVNEDDSVGAVYVYDLSAGSWVQRGNPFSPGGELPESVALNRDGSVLVVGLPSIGTVSTYDFVGSDWEKRSLSDIVNSDENFQHFGYGVAISPDGSVLSFLGQNIFEDQQEIFTYDIDGDLWSSREVIENPDDELYDFVGWNSSLNEDGTILAISIKYYDEGLDEWVYGAIVYDWSGSAWVLRGVVENPDTETYEYFGYAVAISPDGLVLAATADITTEAGSIGGVLLFGCSGSEWIQRGTVFSAPVPQDSDYFGDAIGLCESGVFIGASGMDSPLSDAGAAYWFTLASDAVLTIDKTLTLPAGDYTIKVRLEDDTIASKTFTLSEETTTDEIEVEAFSGTQPAQYDPWALGLTDTETKPFRVTNIRRTSELRCKITAIEYYPEVYDETATVPVIDYIIPLPTILNLRLHIFFDMAGHAQIGIAWDPPRDSYGGAVIMVDGVTVGRVGLTNCAYAHPISVAKTYAVTVLGLDAAGIQSGSLSGSITVDALDIPQVTGLTLTEDTYILPDGTVLTDMHVDYAIPSFAFFGACAIYHKINAGDWIFSGVSSGESFIIKAIKADSINIKVAIRSRGGIEGAGVESGDTQITGKSLPPDNVANFQATQDGNSIDLQWDHVDEPDLRGYEIREGVSWDEGLAVAVNVSTNDTSIPISEERLHTFWIKAVDTSGNVSATASSASITPVILLPKNVILTYDDMALKDGSHSDTEFVASEYTWDKMTGKWSDSPTAKWNDYPLQVLVLTQSAPGVYNSSGQYTTAVRDLGDAITFSVIPRMVAESVQNTSFRLKFRSSADNVTWTDWVDAVAQTITARYIQGRVDLATDDTGYTPRIRVLSWVIDVPDIDRAGAGSVVGVGGATISFGYKYYSVPAVIAMAAGGNRRAEVTTKTTTTFTVVVLDETGTDVGGTVDWHARGY